ncbi:MAG: hypothetical protein MJZ76_04635 [Bacteroidales bacterium]|nr:hypothetical protein [Bacteroidales bacterium]
MKQIFSFAVALFLFGNIFAQSHITFKGVEVDGTVASCTQKLVEQGFTSQKMENGVALLNGNFAEQNCKVKLFTKGKQDLVYSLTVTFNSQDSWDSLAQAYQQLKSVLYAEYGSTTEVVEQFATEVTDDASKMTAFLNGLVSWRTTFMTAEGKVTLFINKTDAGHGACVIRYLDNVNTAATRK